MIGSREGKICFNFDDGGLYSIGDIHMEFGEIVMGQMYTTFCKNLVITDHINGYQAEIIYNPQSESKGKGYMASITSMFKKKTETSV